MIRNIYDNEKVFYKLKFTAITLQTDGKLRKLEKAFNFNLEVPSLKIPGLGLLFSNIKKRLSWLCPSNLVTDQMFIVAVCEINGATMYVYIFFSIFFIRLYNWLCSSRII